MLEPELEEAAATLGASRWQTFARVILPAVWPALLTGFTLAFARAVGEYGSVIFIAGNMPMVSEIAPLLIITKLEQYDYAGATSVAVVHAGDLLRAAAADQPAAVVEQPQDGGRLSMAAVASSLALPAPVSARRRRNCRAGAGPVGLIVVALAFLGVFLLVPLAAVFTEALRKGLDTYVRGARRAGCRRRNPAHAAGCGCRGARQSRLRRRGRVGHRQVRLPGQERARSR